ncbi:MAG: PSD1 and planctomycete cytochrome C domain-containing protein [Isosphaeraceae bacterium]|nr:PSD1 and planctomycete cytochrome C domain-containing protein [Isosphaeraceae bacterium]
MSRAARFLGVFRHTARCLMILTAAASAWPEPVRGDDGGEFFETKIRPILANRCGECHGSAAKIKGGLRLTSREAILAGGDSGAAAVPGKPEESLLVQVLSYVDEPRMPPAARLPEAERSAIEEWIRRGMPWPAGDSTAAATGDPSSARKSMTIGPRERSFWSFQPIRRVAPPSVRHPELAPTPIDRFLQAGLERAAIEPAPATDRRTLIRRATFDLTGLPPSLDEIERFVADADSDDRAFIRVVDRLLASPRYGEKWGRHWLDLVRYADSRDSRGVGSDTDILEAWHYRDYVVSAFNRDLPYDRFIREQIAGDLLQPSDPAAVDVDALVATGLLTIGEWGTGDADKEKMMTDIVADQIDVVSRAFLGLTIGCARCHDHKFDPIPQADYYGLAGIFFSTHILPDPGPKTNGSPMLRTPLAAPAAIEAARKQRERIERLETERKTKTAAAIAELAVRERGKTADYLLAAWESASGSKSGSAIDDSARERGLVAGILRRWVVALGLGDLGTPLLRPLRRVRDVAGVDAWAGPADTPSITVNANSTSQQILTFTLPPRSVNLHPAPDRPVALVWRAPAAGTHRIEATLADADAACGDGFGWRIEHRRGRTWTTLAEGAVENGGRVDVTRQAAARLERVEIAEGDRLRLVVLPKSGHACDTTAVTWKIASEKETWDVAELVTDLIAGGRGNPHVDHAGRPEVWTAVELATAAPAKNLDRLASFARWRAAVDGAERVAVAAAAKSIAEELAQPGAAATSDELVKPGGPFVVEAAELPEELARPFVALDAEIEALRKSLPPTPAVGLVAREGGVPRSPHAGIHDSRIHIRGEYTRLGAVVPRHFPVVIAGEDRPALPADSSGRRELSEWIADPSNPLTARVMANRVWQHHFGEGLVRTAGNFGKLGEPPSHPELLDHLASRLIESGWSIKSLHREIMASAAYRRSSRPSSDATARDPENRLLSRFRRRRLTSEELRDALLTIAGRLETTAGGPADRDFETPRRTLYQICIRSDRSSFGPLFDAADPAALIEKRIDSTVAPQALFLLNHPFVVARAGETARRVLDAPSGDRSARIDRLHEIVFGRSAGTEERAAAELLLDSARDLEPQAAWTLLAQTLICANEFMFVD